MAHDAHLEDDLTEPAGPAAEMADTSRPVVIALLITLVVDVVLAAAMAVLSVGYGQGAAHLLAIGLWAAVALVNGAAAWTVAQSHGHRFAHVLLAQLMALALAGWVLWAAYQSPVRNPAVQWVALAVAGVAVGWIAFLLVKAPKSSALTFSRGWKVVSASFALLSLFSLWLTTTYLPSRERPMVDLSTSLTKLEQRGHSTVLRATITLHNRGLASAVVVGSLYRVYDQFERLPATGGITSFDEFVSNTSSLKSATSHIDDVLSGVFDLTAPNDHDFTGTTDLLKADEILPLREFLLPGQTWSTDVVVTVASRFPSTVRLTAQIALITDRYLGDTTACNGGTANQADADFARQAHRVYVNRLAAPYDPESGSAASSQTLPVDYLCVQTALLPQSAVQALVGNHPSIRTVYVLSDPDEVFYPSGFPFLVTSFQNSTSGGTAGARLRQAQKIDAGNPSAVIESRSEYGMP